MQQLVQNRTDEQMRTEKKHIVISPIRVYLSILSVCYVRCILYKTRKCQGRIQFLLKGKAGPFKMFVMLWFLSPPEQFLNYARVVQSEAIFDMQAIKFRTFLATSGIWSILGWGRVPWGRFIPWARTGSAPESCESGHPCCINYNNNRRITVTSWPVFVRQRHCNTTNQ